MQSLKRALTLFFLAMGSMLTLFPEEQHETEPVEPKQPDIKKHFEAAWRYLDRAVEACQKNG